MIEFDEKMLFHKPPFHKPPCKEDECKDPCGHFPPDPPEFTMTEKIEKAFKEIGCTITALMKFKEELKNEHDCMMSALTSDNVLFKDTFREGYNEFLETVRNEINTFEENVDSSLAFYKETISAEYRDLFDELNTKLETYKTDLNTTYDTFRNAIESRIEQYNSTYIQTVNDLHTTLNLKITELENDLNANYASFTKGINDSVRSFQTEWTELINARLDGQDAMINDSVLYIKANCASYIEALIQRMEDNGEISHIIENTLLPDITNKQNYVNVMDYGAVCDGVTDDSEAFRYALTACNNAVTTKGQSKRVIYIPSNMLIASRITVDFGAFRIQGNSSENCSIKFSGANAGFAVDSDAEKFQIEFANITFKGDGTQTQMLYFNRVSNLYFDHVNVEGCADGYYNVKLKGCGLVFVDNCIIQGSSNNSSDPMKKGIYVDGLGSILNIQNCNIWNLHNFITFNGRFNNVNIVNNWCECVKEFIHVDCVDSMTAMTLKVEGNNISAHDVNGISYANTPFAFIEFNSTSTTNFFETAISVKGNSFYLANMTALKNDSLIHIPHIATGGTVYIAYSNNVFTGSRLWQLNSFVAKVNDETKPLVRFVEAVVASEKDGKSLSNVLSTVFCSLYIGSYFTAPNGIYLTANPTLNNGRLYYADGNFYGGYNGTIKALPVTTGNEISALTGSADLATTVSKLNEVITQLKASHIID